MEVTVSANDFFVLRSARLSIDHLMSILNTESNVQEQLEKWLQEDSVLEAIYIASPSLHARIDKWLNESNPVKRAKTGVTLLKYFIRMTSRPTPFGLFAGVGLGQLSDKTSINASDDTLQSRKTRFDLFMLGQLKAATARKAIKDLSYCANPSIYVCGNTIRYIEHYDSQESKHYRLAAVERTEILDYAIEFCELPVSFSEIHLELRTKYNCFSHSELESYVKLLINESIIIAHLPLPVISNSPDEAMLELLKPYDEHKIFKKGIEQLNDLDKSKKNNIKDYKNIVTTLEELPIKIQENKLFQVDIVTGLDNCELDSRIATSLRRKIELISRANTLVENPLTPFIAKFQKHFGDQLVPLSKVLDDESGIGFSNDSGYESSLLVDLDLRIKEHSPKKEILSPLQKLILHKMNLPESKRAGIVQLSSQEVEKAIANSDKSIPLPFSYAAVTSLFEQNDHQKIIKLISVYGPSAANLLGRFCHVDENLVNRVKGLLKREEEHSEGVVFAEVVYMPDGRPGNVVVRPRLRDYEIAFFADSDIGDENLIAIGDLSIWIEDGNVNLWSEKLKKRVIPRMSNAHNFSSSSLSIYRFLCSLQYQQYSIPTNIAPEVFSSFSIAPRVMLDNVVLHEKTWRFPHSELANVLVDNEYCVERYKLFKKKYDIDDFVTFTVTDNTLTFNLLNPVSFSLLVQESKKFNEVVVKESLSNQYKSVVKDRHGARFSNEIIIPFENRLAEPYKMSCPDQHRGIDEGQRTFTPGSEWMSIKIYVGNNQAEHLLMETLAPIVRSQSSLYQKWFFIRYNEPDWHLRIRFLGDPKVLYGKLLPEINKCLQSFVVNNATTRVELFTYERELERYGGERLLQVCETLFMLESELVTALLPLIHVQGDDLRWRAAAQCIDRVLSNFGYTIESKLQLITKLRNAFGKEFNEGRELRKQFGQKYLTLKSTLINDFYTASKFDQHRATSPQYEFWSCIFNWDNKYKEMCKSAFFEINTSKLKRDELLASILHMLNNRFFSAYTREHEFVMYDILRRYYLFLIKSGG